ncbi:MAG: hypothetical protein HC880_10185 [Bacteroidia bacterium]|nr:hypothetical protein [Bacteroidia bacterium]
MESEGLGSQKAAELIKYVKDSFQFEAFKDLARDIDQSDFVDVPKIIDLLKEWQLIEAREFYKLSLGRIETIKKFESYIDSGVKEVPTMHNFIKTFPWLLDPRIIEFKDEVRYSKILKEKYPEEHHIPDEDKRIDFCVLHSQLIYL